MEEMKELNKDLVILQEGTMQSNLVLDQLMTKKQNINLFKYI